MRATDRHAFQQVYVCECVCECEGCVMCDPPEPPAVVGLVPSVRSVVSQHLDAETLTSQLKTKCVTRTSSIFTLCYLPLPPSLPPSLPPCRPDNKVTLWENLKIVSFSRLVAGVYACSLLVVFLRVQLSVLGGCMFLDLQKVHIPLAVPYLL